MRRGPALEPMYASVGREVPAGDGWTYEPKYDGIRVLAFATAGAARLVTRNGNDKAAQFPEVADALRALARRLERSLVLDGELVGLERGEAGGAPARFQSLQGRMHLDDADGIAEQAAATPAALIAFDLLVDGDDVLLREPWTARRARLERALGTVRRTAKAVVRLGESVVGDGDAMMRRACDAGWEGVIAKRVDAPYAPGRRAAHWLKLKIEHRQELVVGGYTDPRNSRQHIGALLLGYYDDAGRFVYAGHTGGGFTRAGLADMHRRLAPLARTTSPFAGAFRANEAPHWVRPAVVVEVKFTEWTSDGRLRQPIFVGVRDDKPARSVTREGESVQGATRRAPPRARAAPPEVPNAPIALSNLDKPYFPDGTTKGDLVRYYTEVAPYILPAVADRPLVLRRFPNGVDGKAFYQHRVDDPPNGVRTALVDTDGDGKEMSYLVGGDLATLLYAVQLGAVSVDPWHSRVSSDGSPHTPDYTIVDLDPGPKAPFARVVEVARWVKEELDAFGLRAGLKTSGATGVHVVLPLPPRTRGETALLLAQLVATRVAERHPREATVERSIAARRTDAVYVDYVQNVVGKTVAAAYSVRARPTATVSTPLAWDELTDALDPTRFTIRTVPRRLAERGDLWKAAMRARNSLRALRAVVARSG